MKSSNWQLHSPASAIIFDCDGTLTKIEGIDELARLNGVEAEVKKMTALAMNQTGLNPDLYARRLALVKPTKAQVNELGKTYFQHRTTDIAEVLSIFNRLNKTIYIMSAGLYPSIDEFAKLLQLNAQNIFAVNITFDGKGDYHDFDRTSPLVENIGKRQLVMKLKKTHEKIIYVGDGLNDLSTIDEVMRFIGYGGVFYRENIREQSDFYISAPSMTQLLPLCLTDDEIVMLTSDEKKLYELGINTLSKL